MNSSEGAQQIPKAGEILAGKYRIERAIAEGGMGVVVEATHLQLEERVAIKFLKPEVLGDNAAEVSARFLREARAAIKIRSEHVVRVFDVSALDGIPYIVMELLVGEDLDQLISHKGALPAADAVDHVLQACEALSEAHALGIVHRDLKPANLFLTHSTSGMPIVKVLDFGISKLASASGDMSMTSTQAVMGSPLYMSPEQMRATRDADARSDIWAIGVILYELLAGRPPFNGDTMTQVCAAILQDDPEPFAPRRKDVPVGLERVVMRCLEKKPQDRFASIGELAPALAPFASMVGQEAARRTGRAVKFAADAASRMSSPSVTELTPTRSDDVNSVPAKAHGAGATSISWGDERDRPKKSKMPVVMIGLVVTMAAAAAGVVAFRKAPESPRREAATGATVSQASSPPSIPTATQPAHDLVAPADGIPPLASASAESPSADPVATAATSTTAKAVASAAPAVHTTKPKKSAAPSPTPSTTKPGTTPPPKASWDDRK